MPIVHILEVHKLCQDIAQDARMVECQINNPQPRADADDYEEDETGLVGILNHRTIRRYSRQCGIWVRHDCWLQGKLAKWRVGGDLQR